MNRYPDKEFFDIIEPIINNKEFQKTKNITHHGITRYDHSMRVAYISYKITKLMRLDYKETTEAALLHDFFTTEVEYENGFSRLIKHPKYAVENAKKHFVINEKQEDIIKTHMFPITLLPPKYLESWIVDLVDDISAIYEKTCTTKKELQAATTFLFIFLINIIKFR